MKIKINKKFAIIGVLFMCVNFTNAQFTPPITPYTNGPYTPGTTNLSTLPVYVHGSTVDNMIYLGRGPGTTIFINEKSTALGVGVLSSNIGGQENTGVGFRSLYSTSSANLSTALGAYSLFSNVSGHQNTAVGYKALYTNSNAQYNVAVGCNALFYSNSYHNVAVGNNALAAQTSGDANTAVGSGALATNQIGRYNVAMGNASMSGFSGDQNTAVGASSLSTGTGKDNTSIGYLSMNGTIVAGDENVAIGGRSMLAFRFGKENTAIGHSALIGYIGCDDCKWNVGLGFQSMYNLKTGHGNLALGSNAVFPVDAAGFSDYQLSIQNVIYGKDMNATASGKIGIGVVPSQINNLSSLSNNGYARLRIGGTGLTSPSLQLNNVPVYNGIQPITRYLYVDAEGVVCQATLPPAGTVNLANEWHITGNSGTVDGVNYIGTNDNAPFNIRQGVIGNVVQRAGRIDLGKENTFYGSLSGENSTVGTDNTAIGFSALTAVTTGAENTVVGAGALDKNTTGHDNTGMGVHALTTNVSGSYNTALGTLADVSSPSLQNATAIGYAAIAHASNEVQVGNTSVAEVIIGDATPSPAGQTNLITSNFRFTRGDLTSGYVLTNSGGGQAEWLPLPDGPGQNGAWLINGNYNVVDGDYIGSNLANVGFTIRLFNELAGRIDPEAPASTRNTFFGLRAGNNNSTGSWNTAIGEESLSMNTIGAGNTAVGYQALFNNAFDPQSFKPAINNTAVGRSALRENISGNVNIAIGAQAMMNNIEGRSNVAVGYNSLLSNTDGLANVSIGTQSLISNTHGNYNVALGENALSSNNTGDNNIGIGNGADVTLPGLGNAIAIGNGALVSNSNTIQLGNTTITDAFLGNTNPSAGPTAKFTTGQLRVTGSPSATGYILMDNTSGGTGDATWQPFPIGCCNKIGSLETEVDELKKQNELLKKEMEEIKALIKSSTSSEVQGSIKITQTNVDAQLFQNAPNPFNKSTVIRYSIPAVSKKAMLTITSLSGVKIKEFDLKNKNGQSIEISGGQLSAGTYIYSLIVDDTFIDAKQMILTR